MQETLIDAQKVTTELHAKPAGLVSSFTPSDHADAYVKTAMGALLVGRLFDADVGCQGRAKSFGCLSRSGGIKTQRSCPHKGIPVPASKER